MSLIERTFRERIILVGVAIPPVSLDETEEHLDELSRLINTAGADEAARVVQRRDAPDAATYMTEGPRSCTSCRWRSTPTPSCLDDVPSPTAQPGEDLWRTAIDRTDVIG